MCLPKPPHGCVSDLPFRHIITRPTETHRFSTVSDIASRTMLGDSSSTQIVLKQRINDQLRRIVRQDTTVCPWEGTATAGSQNASGSPNAEERPSQPTLPNHDTSALSKIITHKRTLFCNRYKTHSILPTQLLQKCLFSCCCTFWWLWSSGRGCRRRHGTNAMAGVHLLE